jgi:hypothetical protein
MWKSDKVKKKRFLNGETRVCFNVKIDRDQPKRVPLLRPTARAWGVEGFSLL